MARLLGILALAIVLACSSLSAHAWIGGPDLAQAAAHLGAERLSSTLHGRISAPPPPGAPRGVPSAAGAGHSGELTLVSYNSFFLPAVARLLLSGWRGVQDDLRRSKSLASHLVQSKFDLICLEEVFRMAPRQELERQLRLGGYYVVPELNPDGWVRANSGLFFASRWPIVTHHFEVFADKSYLTSDAFALKGVGFALVNITTDPAAVSHLGEDGTAARSPLPHHPSDASTGAAFAEAPPPGGSTPASASAVSHSRSPGTLLCVFLTHLQAETRGRAARAMQLAQVSSFIRRTIKQLALPHPCAVVLAGDFNVNGLRDDDGEEYEEMIRLLDHPTDLSRLLHPLEKRADAVTCDEERVDYVFVYAPRVGLRVAPVQVLNYSVAPEWWLPGEPPENPIPPREVQEPKSNGALAWLRNVGLPAAEAFPVVPKKLALSDHRAVVTHFRILASLANPTPWRQRGF
eukprot:RCo004456